MKTYSNKLKFIQTSSILCGTMLGVTLGIGVMLSSSTASADNDSSVVDQINITIPVSCTMSGTGINTHNAEITNGTYTPNIGTTTLHAFCNDNEGFAIYATGYTGNTIGETNSNKLVGTNASSNSTIESGIATSAGNPDISNWAMKLTAIQDSGDITGTNAFTIDSAPNVALPSEAEQGATSALFSDYHMVPNEYTKVAHKNSLTDMTASTGGVKLTTTYAAYISKTQPADTYSGQVIYTLVHPASAEAPFACKPDGTTISTIVCMQDITSSNKTSVLASMTEDTQYQLYDSRDEKQYYVAKLKDGNIWMTQNLDLDIDSTKTYTSTDTDLPIGTTWVPDNSTYVTSDDTWESSASYGGTIAQSYDPGNYYWDETIHAFSEWDAYFDSCYQEPYICDDSLEPSAYLDVSGDSHYHLGNYYSYTAAIAMNRSSGIIEANQSVNQSICPAGWKLPRNGFYYDSEQEESRYYDVNGSFYHLLRQYGLEGDVVGWRLNTAWHLAPLYLALSGSYDGDGVHAGFSGRYNTDLISEFYPPASMTNSYGLEMAGVDANTIQYEVTDETMRRIGLVIRCVVIDD